MRRPDPNTASQTRHGLRAALSVVLGAMLAGSTGCQDYAPVEPAPVGVTYTPPTPPRSPFGDHIHLADADGTVTRKLAEGSWPSWSPDGRRIAFHRDAEVYVIDADGTNERRLASGEWATWSPDGARIAFATPDGIALMNADGSSSHLLMSPGLFFEHSDGGVGKLAWSPDGALIAFEHFTDGWLSGPSRVFVMTADGRTQRALTPQPWQVSESDPSWSPDGTRVLYWSYDHGIGTIGRGGGATSQLYSSLPDLQYDTRPAWSPDGSTIAFNSPRPLASILTIPSSGGAPTKLIQDGYHAAWSPDGKRLAFVRRHEP